MSSGKLRQPHSAPSNVFTEDEATHDASRALEHEQDQAQHRRRQQQEEQKQADAAAEE